MPRSDKTPTIHQIIVSNIINANKGVLTIHPDQFRRTLGQLMHIRKEYSILIIKELAEVGLISEYSGKEIVFDKKKIDNIFLE
jgi:hypothetical protein